MRFRVGDELRRARDRQLVIHDQHARHDCHERYRREALHRIVGQVPVDRRIHRERAEVSHHEGVAVGRRARRGFGADRAAGAGPVVDHDRLGEAFGELLPEGAREEVGRAARWKRHDQADRARRIAARDVDALGSGLRGYERQRRDYAQDLAR